MIYVFVHSPGLVDPRQLQQGQQLAAEDLLFRRDPSLLRSLRECIFSFPSCFVCVCAQASQPPSQPVVPPQSSAFVRLPSDPLVAPPHCERASMCALVCWQGAPVPGKEHWAGIPPGSWWPEEDPNSCDGFFGNGWREKFSLLPPSAGATFNCSYHPGTTTHTCETGTLALSACVSMVMMISLRSR